MYITTIPIYCYLSTDGLYTTAPVRVVVEDVNDNHPSFNPVDYNINVQEGVALGSLLTVRATDADSNSIGTVVYSIHSGNDQGFFTIDPSSGECLNTYRVMGV